MFVDRVKLKLIAGKGGNGVVAWHREKYIPKGGPAGGNGGPGGSIIFKASGQINSLDSFKNRRLLKAENGGCGGINQRQGRRGQDLILQVPCGTLIKDAQDDQLIADLTEEGSEWILCRGGRGGRGNASFRTSTNRAPATAKDGDAGEEKSVELELKLIADIGFVGFPNAGKSTLLKALTAASVKVAAYPFTTLHPNLGCLQYEDFRRLLLADIPGLIEGAHHNRGLGLEFLRHIERTKALIFVLDASGFEGRNPIEDFAVLRQELLSYGHSILAKPFIIALNKCDMEGSKEQVELFKASYSEKEPIFEIAALTGQGLVSLKEALYQFLPLLGASFLQQGEKVDSSGQESDSGAGRPVEVVRECCTADIE